MTKTIYVIGPSSTGKTTLCDALAKKLGIPKSAYVKEVARHVMKEQGYSRETIGLLAMQQAIMNEHIRREEEGRESSRIQLCDRSAIDPIVYAILTSSTVSEAQDRQNILINSQNFQRALERYRSSASTVILLTPVADWLVDDGVRHTEDQEKCLKIYRKLLAELQIRYREVGQDMRFLPERVVTVIGFAKL